MVQKFKYRLFPDKKQWRLLYRQAGEDASVYMYAFNKFRDQQIKTHHLRSTDEMIEMYCLDKALDKPYAKEISWALMTAAIERARADVLKYVVNKERIPSAYPKNVAYFNIETKIYINRQHKILIPRLIYSTDRINTDLEWVQLDYGCNLPATELITEACEIRLSQIGPKTSQWHIIFECEPAAIQKAIDRVKDRNKD